MTPHQRQAIREAIGALDFAAQLARIDNAQDCAKMYEHAAEGLRVQCWFPAPNSLGEILIPLVPEPAPPSEEFLRNYAHHAQH